MSKTTNILIWWERREGNAGGIPCDFVRNEIESLPGHFINIGSNHNLILREENFLIIMMGLIFAILGAVAAYRLWGDHAGLAILAIAATLYQTSSLNEMLKERRGLQPEDKTQTLINMAATVVILGLLIYSFLS